MREETSETKRRQRGDKERLPLFPGHVVETVFRAAHLRRRAAQRIAGEAERFDVVMGN